MRSLSGDNKKPSSALDSSARSAHITVLSMATPAPLIRTRRDRRGRGMRGIMIAPIHPAFRTRREHFDETVQNYVRRLEQTWGQELAGTEFAVEDVPPSDPAPWETGGVPMGRYFPSVGGAPNRIAIYRRPVEGRVTEHWGLESLVRDVIVEQVAFVLSRSPQEIDSEYQGG
ncbi:metallopeptidase family protein [Jonesiaceae bacterium BS-20]|uniref:Metallopeptidase family protein n=1 Tax=Jonesiaceae bacterium BS-20 TaxID=3120821 RepID=A0AAU7DX94_9MICO